WRADVAFASYKNLDEIDPDVRITKVFFRAKGLPIWKQTIEGLPELSHLRKISGPDDVVRLTAGEHNLAFFFSPTGGSGIGVEVLIECESRDVIEPISVRLRHWFANEPGVEAPAVPAPGTEWQAWRADFPDLPIPGALPRFPAGTPGGIIMKYADEHNRRAFELSIRLRILQREAQSRLHLVVQPVANRDHGATDLELSLSASNLK